MDQFQRPKVVLSSLLILLGFLVYSSVAQMKDSRFKSYIKPLCYNKKSYGQDYPLGNTMKNFINLVEKFEFANPELSLIDTTFLLLRNFSYNNLMFPAFVQWDPPGSSYKTLIQGDLWQKQIKDLAPHTNPYSDDETCSLHFMLSHAVQRAFRKSLKPFDWDWNIQQKPDMYESVRETGVVAIEMTNHVVEINRVLMGVFLGLKTDRNRTLDDLLKESSKEKRKEVDGVEPLSSFVDPLYSFTLADALTAATWENNLEADKGVMSFGSWADSPFQYFSEICPIFYEFGQTDKGRYSIGSLRAGEDGLVLGSIVKGLSDAAPDLRLSQILRMYYSRQGITYPRDWLNKKTISVCSRKQNMITLLIGLQSQLGKYMLLMGIDVKNFTEIRNYAMNTYVSNTDFGTHDSDLKTTCMPRDTPLARLPSETPNSIIAVLDTRNGLVPITKQKWALADAVNNLDLWEAGSKMTVLLDQLNDAAGTTEKTLKVLIPETSSSTCVACRVHEYDIAEGEKTEDEADILEGLNNFLKAKKEEQAQANGVPGIVVLFFKFGEWEEITSTSKAIRDFNAQNADVTVIAVGKNSEVLEKYASGDDNVVVFTETDYWIRTSDKMIEKISFAPANLQYTDCKIAWNEEKATYKGSVTRGSVQRWTMNPEYFLKSYNTKFHIDVPDGFDIEVCHSRTNPRPELHEDQNCKNSTITDRRVEFVNTNPCKGYNVYNCPPMYFSVIGLQPPDEMTYEYQYCSGTPEVVCKRLDQIPYTISHEGIRCSGGSIAASTLSLLLASIIFVCFTFTKN